MIDRPDIKSLIAAYVLYTVNELALKVLKILPANFAKKPLLFCARLKNDLEAAILKSGGDLP